MSKYTIFLAFLLFCIFLHRPASNAGDLNAFYSSDYDGFWAYWNEVKSKAVACRSTMDTSLFLANAVITLGNAEVTQGNAEVIEKLTLENPKCLLAAATNLSVEDQTTLVRFFLLKPIYNSTEDLEKSLSSAWGDTAFDEFRKLYAQLKESS